MADTHRVNTVNYSWNPISKMKCKLNRLFDDWITPATCGLQTTNEFYPNCNVTESEDRYLIGVELQGVDKDDINLEVIGNRIKISGERHLDSTDKGSQLGSAGKFDQFQRQFTLPRTVNTDKIEAKFHDDILEVIIPKSDPSRSRHIKIKKTDT